jgi:hypothetical protein
MTTLTTTTSSARNPILFGSVGFAIGLAIAGPGALFGAASATDSILPSILHLIGGGIGGLCLGLAARQGVGWSATAAGLAGGLGWWLTSVVLGLFNGLDQQLHEPLFSLQYILVGAIVGGSLGAVGGNWARAGRMAAAGAVGYWLFVPAFYLVVNVLGRAISGAIAGSLGQRVHDTTTVMLVLLAGGLVGGALAGACLGWASRTRINQAA